MTIVERLRGEHWWLNVCGDEIADEIERLQGEIRTLHAHLNHRSDMNTKLRAEIERLHAALSHYGDHLYECELKNGGVCTCGYEAALEAKP